MATQRTRGSGELRCGPWRSRGLTLLAAVLLASQACSQDESPAEHEHPWDPLAGMDPNGRIPSKKPDDLEHPERWRYIPEARLMEGNVFERFLVTSFFSPIFFFEEEIGFGGGLAITDIDFRNQRRREFANVVVSYTTEGQQAYQFTWRRWLNHRELEGGGVVQDERSFWHANAGYHRTLTRRFFGLGPDTEADDETSFTDEVVEVELYQQRSIPDPADDLIANAGLRFERHNLSGGRKSPSTNTVPELEPLFDEGDGHSLLWVDLGLQWNTRDSLHNPYRGWHLGGSASFAPIQTGGDVGALLGLSGSEVIEVPPLFHHGGDPDEENPPTDVIAFGAQLGQAVGDLPFYVLPSLGGTRTLRGYIGNRFTDRAAWHATAEYRMWFLPRGFAFTDTVRIERIGGALFYDVGSVAHDVGDLFDAAVHQSYGVGLRVSFERSALFRFDVGFSDEGSNFSIAYGLSF